MTLADKLRPYVKEIREDADKGDPRAKEIISLYHMHCTSPADPGAPALCEAAFDEWKKGQSYD